jgi:hypothetical protein
MMGLCPGIEGRDVHKEFAEMKELKSDYMGIYHD